MLLEALVETMFLEKREERGVERGSARRCSLKRERREAWKEEALDDVP